MFCFNEFAFTVQVKQKNSIQINSWLYFDMSVFYDWPFPHVYFAKNVAYFPFNSWHSFQQLCCLLWGLLLVLLHLFNGLFSRTTWLSRYQKVKTSLDLNEARDDGDGSGSSWTIYNLDLAPDK